MAMMVYDVSSGYSDASLHYLSLGLAAIDPLDENSESPIKIAIDNDFTQSLIDRLIGVCQ
jgi:hypothetical protein